MGAAILCWYRKQIDVATLPHAQYFHESTELSPVSACNT